MIPKTKSDVAEVLIKQPSNLARMVQNNWKASNVNFDALPESPVVGQLHKAYIPVNVGVLCSDVLALFLQDEELRVIPVVDERNVPKALIERYAYIEYFTRLYSNELFGRKRLEQLRDHIQIINMQPIVVDAATSIDDVAAIIVNSGERHLVSGFIITNNEKYLGVGNIHDLLNHITQRKQAELYYLAHFDQLTRIPNRMLMNDRLQMACRESDRKNTTVGLMFIDLDRFKHVNDSMGHRFGDILLQGVAKRLTSCIRGNDTVARLGGDEFAVLLENLSSENDTDATAQRIIDSFRLPFNILDREIFITASLGIAIYPRDAQKSSDLLSKADAAMYEAKSGGRNSFRIYTPGMWIQSDHLSLEADLRYVIERNELVLHYQPQMNVESGDVIGVEAP